MCTRYSGLTPDRLPRLVLNSEVKQVVLVLLLVLENSRYLTVTLIERSSAGRFGPCFAAGSQQIEHEHDSLTSESGLISRTARDNPCTPLVLMRLSEAAKQKGSED